MRRFGGFLGVAVLAIAALWGSGTAHAQDLQGVVAVTEKVSVAQNGGEAPVRLLVSSAAGRITASIEGDSASVANRPCLPSPAAGVDGFARTVFLDARTGGDDELVELCIKTTGSESTRLVVASALGGSVVIPVAVKAPPVAPAPTAPSKLKYVTGDAVRRATVSPGFAVADEMRAVATGVDDTATIVVSPMGASCESAAPTTSTLPSTTTSTGPAQSAPSTTTAPAAPTKTKATSTHVLICDADEIGEYTATFDLNGDEEGGALEVTAVRRQTGWLAVLAVVFGGALAFAFEALGSRADSKKSAAKEEEAEEKAEAAAAGARTAHDRVSEILYAAGDPVQTFAPAWAPQKWPALAAATVAAEEKSAAASDYLRAARAVRPLLALWAHYQDPASRAGLTGAPPLASAALNELRHGVTLHQPDDSVELVAHRLHREALLARHALRRDVYLLRELESATGAWRSAVIRERALIAAAGLDQVDDIPPAFEVPEVVRPDRGDEPDLTVLVDAVRAQYATRGRYAAADWYEDRGVADTAGLQTSVPMIGLKIEGPDSSSPRKTVPAHVRLALQSTQARVAAIVLGGVIGVMVGAADAFDPDAAWGSTNELLKMAGAASAGPTLLSQARKLLSIEPAKA